MPQEGDLYDYITVGNEDQRPAIAALVGSRRFGELLEECECGIIEAIETTLIVMADDLDDLDFCEWEEEGDDDVYAYVN